MRSASVLTKRDLLQSALVSNRICVVTGARVVRARLRPWGDTASADGSPGLLYWRSHRWNGHVHPDEEGFTWIRGWLHDRKTLDALVVAAALSR